MSYQRKQVDHKVITSNLSLKLVTVILDEGGRKPWVSNYEIALPRQKGQNPICLRLKPLLKVNKNISPLWED